MNSQILAKVNGVVITASDVEAELAALGPRGQEYNTPEGREALLEQLINKKLFLADATKNLYDPAKMILSILTNWFLINLSNWLW